METPIKHFKTSFATRLFFRFGALLWIPIFMGVVSMLYTKKPIALFAAAALGVALASYVISTIVRQSL